MLRSRTTRREDPFDPHVPDPVVSPHAGADPEQEALLANSVGLALLVVLETLPPAERLAFVLHDMFALPSRLARPALVNGAAGAVITVHGQPVSIMSFTVTDGKIVAIDSLGDPERLSRLDLAAFDDKGGS